MDARTQLGKRTEELAELFEKRLGIRGRGFETKLRRAGREVPRAIRREARMLAEAERMAAHPKRRAQVDPDRVERAYRACRRWLETVDPAERRKDRVLSLLAVNAFNLALVATLLVVWLVQSGTL